MVQRKRFGTALAGVALLLAVATGLVFAAATPIANSKHNFAAGGTGTSTIKAAAGGTTEICVFCHTPHSANITSNLGVPLWNKAALTGATYALYSSTYLTGLGYPSPVLGAGQSSRVCLTCHDGTVALGSVVNAPGSGVGVAIQMANSGVNFAGGIPTTVAGNLGGAAGTNLADDHPLGYLYQAGVAAGQDPELVVRGWPWPAGVQLDPNTSAGRVECKSCHNPHDNQYAKFLRVSNANGALCKTCHNKPGYIGSGHDTSTQAFTPWTGATAITVGNRSCLGCHKPHTAAGTPLLKGAEEVTCYDAGCHGSNNPIAGNTTQGQNNVQPLMGLLHSHPTNTVSGKHVDKVGGELVADLGVPNRHAECYDCHNPHQVRLSVEKSTRSTLRISAALTGTWGVQPTWPAVPTGAAVTTNAITFGAAPGTYTKVSGGTLTDEYQVCLKCHSNYVTLPAGVRNLAVEINPGNSSYHGIVPLVGAPTAIVAATQQNNATNFFVNQNTMVQPWAGNTAFSVIAAETCRQTPTGASCVAFAASRGRVWCSDCHNATTTTMPPTGTKSTTGPSGPHGSTAAGATAAPSNSDRMLFKTLVTTGGATPLCLACHLSSAYTSKTLSRNITVHTAAYRGMTEGCFGCHMWDRSTGTYTGTGKIFPHGMNKRWVNVTGTATAGSGHMVDSFLSGYQSNINYATKTCTTESGCAQTRNY